MSNPLTASQTLELAAELAKAAARCSALENEIVRKHRRKTDLLAQQQRLATESAAVKLAEDTELARLAGEQARADAQSGFERRNAHILEAWKRSQTQALQRIESREDIRKYKLQTETMQAARVRKEGLAAAEKSCVDFKTDLEVETQSVMALEQAARHAFQGYGRFVKLLTHGAAPEPPASLDECHIIDLLRGTRAQAQTELAAFQRFVAPQVFRLTPVFVALLLAAFPALFLLRAMKLVSGGYGPAGAFVAALFAVGLGLYFWGRSRCQEPAESLARKVLDARKMCDACLARSEARHAREIQRIEAEHTAKNQWITDQWGRALDDSEQSAPVAQARVDKKNERAIATASRLFQKNLHRLECDHARTVARLQSESESKLREVLRICGEKEAVAQAEFDRQWSLVNAQWRAAIDPIFAKFRQSSALEPAAVEWTTAIVDAWRPPAQFEPFASFGRLTVNPAEFDGAPAADSRLALPVPAPLSLPLVLTFPEQGSLLIETRDEQTEAAAQILNSVILRLLAKAPPGRLNFTIFDPVALGQNFAGVMHLADYEERLINSRIWTQPRQIDEKLAELNEHMEKVIQMYLRNEYATIAEYNEQAGNIAEKYHFVVVANFPAGFSETAIQRLLSIAASGARCGVFTLIHWDHRQIAPSEFAADALLNNSARLILGQGRLQCGAARLPGIDAVADSAPSPELAIRLINKIGLASRDSNRIEVPFSHVAPRPQDYWTEDTSSELRVAVGRTGATKLQYMAIGKGTKQHALLAGKTGSGKSTLFHVIITNLALWCSPEQVEFYLVDFKKGVEFKCYATHKLPHARVVAIESDREFGLSVLQRIDAELKRRGDLFRSLGVQDLAGYKRAGGTEPVPRTLLIIDEFQEFFVEDDKVSQGASLLLDRIVRQGRAFGIHAILGSQTLGGAYTMARTTLGQMVIRIALQCNEADSHLIMDENNAAPRLLTRPGEGIYNDSAGAIEGNSPFQTVWLSDDERDEWLDKVHDKALEAEKYGVSYPGPIVYEGDAPADLRDNPLLSELLAHPLAQSAAASKIWLGAPNSIKGPTEAAFQRQSGNHLLIVGQRDETVLASFAAALAALLAQNPDPRARFILADASAPGSQQREYIEQLAAATPRINLARNSDLPDIMAGLSADLRKAVEDTDETRPETFLLILGLQRFSKLRYEEDFAFSSDPATATHPAVVFNTLLCEGASRGFHVIASCDSYGNLTRFLSRKALAEFEMRVLFQMSATDSASLIDSPRAANLGLHRAIFSNAKEGYLEIFRPYALPPLDWVRAALAGTGK